jgi:hypothetical protein
MKGVFWNSRGLGDLAKHRFLAELVKEEQINFITISEIGRDSFPDLSHLISEEEPSASHMCARISSHTYDRQK